MNEIVLDASALLAFLREEPGASKVAEVLENTAYMSAVNWAEVLSKISELEIDYNNSSINFGSRAQIWQNFELR